MGIETAIAIGALGTLSAVGEYNSTKSASRAAVKQGAIAAENRKQDIQQLAARQRVSFLQAGLDLEGTPQNVIGDTYNTGIADINNIKNTYNQNIKNMLTQGRAKLLGSLATSALGAYSTYSMGFENMGATKEVTESGGLFSSGKITGTIPVQPRKPLF